MAGFQDVHPKFAQSTVFTFDVGPQINDFMDGLEQHDAMAAIAEAHENMGKIRDNIQGAVAGYRRILGNSDMKDDKTAEKDFDGTLEAGNAVL